MKSTSYRRYQNIRTKKEYSKYYQSKEVAEDYALRDFTGLSPLITYAETEIILTQVEKQNISKGSYLDLATGSGRILSNLEKYFKNSTGVDSSKIMLQIAKKRTYKSTLKLADIANLPFKNKAFDLITVFRFIINVPKDERAKIFLEINRILKKDGVLIFNLHHNKISPHGILDILTKNRSPGRTISICGIKKELHQAGFKVMDFKGVNIATLAYLLPFASRKQILKINSGLNSLYPLKIISDTIIIAATKENK